MSTPKAVSDYMREMQARSAKSFESGKNDPAFCAECYYPAADHSNRKGKIKLAMANQLVKEHGEWVWDGLLYEQNGITDPELQILPNRSGSRLRRILRECYNLKY